MNNQLIRFFSKNPIDSSCDIIDSKTLNIFRCSLLYAIFLTASFFSFLVATLSVFDIFPLSTLYRNVLYAYFALNIFAYILLKKDQQYYFLSMNLSILSSLATFTLMTFTVLHDEFRLVWFFLTSFASFILGGRRYGIAITIMIIITVITLHIRMDLALSNYAIFTFISALMTFNIFSHFFLNKIEKDSSQLQERVLQEVEKQQAQEQILLQQSRMTNMGEMIDAIAHQWRQPLTETNILLLDIEDDLETNKFDSPATYDKIEKLFKLTEHMSQTIDDFRNLLKKDKQRNVFDIDTTIQEVLVLINNNLKEIDVNYTSISSVSMVGYKNELIQVLIIILSNAVEALNTHRVQHKTITITLKETNSHLIIGIEDNAGGIDKEIINYIFDPYFTNKEKSSGSGLGLYIAKIIVEESMQGSLIVTNTDTGAKFNIKIQKSS